MSANRVVLATALCLAFLCVPSSAWAGPYSSHSQMYSCCTDSATKEAMFREAKESGAAYIRVDFNLPAVFAPERYGDDVDLVDQLLPGLRPRPAPSGPDWSDLDEIADLSRRYQLPVLGIMLGSPDPAASCPTRIDRERLCPPRDPGLWAAQAAAVAARYRGTIGTYEIWNEPDGRWAFSGEPEDYARMLSASYAAIKAQAPGVQVVLGGTQFAGARGDGWLYRVFRTPGTAAARKFDIASIHLRGTLAAMTADLARRQRFLRQWGRVTPMWVTEHGYPGATRWQRDPAYQGGEAAQAAYLAESLPTLALAGADQVFVTLRDGGGGEFDSEGILRGKGRRGEPFARKGAFWAVRDAAAQWPLTPLRPAWVRSRVRLAHRRSRVRLVVRGRFHGPSCAGRLRLTLIRPGRAAVRRTAKVARDCRYRRVIVLARPRRSTRVRIAQRYLGGGRIGPGDARVLRVMLRR